MRPILQDRSLSLVTQLFQDIVQRVNLEDHLILRFGFIFLWIGKRPGLY